MEKVMILLAGLVGVVKGVGGNIITVGLLYTAQQVVVRLLKTVTGGLADRVLASLCGLCGEVRLN